MSFQIEESNPLLENLIKSLSLDKMVMKLQDETIDRMQANFDPGFKPEPPSHGEFQGENFNKLYSASEVSVWINSSPEKVRAYLANPAFTEMMRQKYNIEFGKTFIKGKDGNIYRAGINFLGVREDSDLLVLANEPDKPVVAYLAAALPSRIIIIANPARGGTLFTLAFMTMPPTAFTVDLANALNNSGQIPKVVERALIDIKIAVEGQS